jgi:hypothetical protein
VTQLLLNAWGTASHNDDPCCPSILHLYLRVQPLQYTWLQHQPRSSIWLRAVALVSRPVDYSLIYNNCWDLADK